MADEIYKRPWSDRAYGKHNYRKVPDLDSDVTHIFTDGSSFPNTGLGNGGWGVLLLHGDHRKELFGGRARTTNNAMELSAIYYGLEAIRKPDLPTRLYTDSQYCLNALLHWWDGWEARCWRTATGGPVKNLDLLKAIQEQRQRFTNLSFWWVKGHVGDPHNEVADGLAKRGRLAVRSRRNGTQ